MTATFMANTSEEGAIKLSNRCRRTWKGKTKRYADWQIETAN